MIGRTGDALHAAYASPENSARALIELTHPNADLSRMSDKGFGLICDPRPEHAEKSPSFSTWQGKDDGGAMFQRKGTEETWNALQWLEQYGNSGAGMTRAEAAKLLISRAGVLDTRVPSRVAGSSRPNPLKLSARLRTQQGQNYAAEPLQAIRGWKTLKGACVGVQTHSAAWKALENRGLLPALDLNFLDAYWRPPQSARSISSLITSDALAFAVRGPDGPAPVAVKYRNDGTAEQLEASKKDRYVYPKGHKGVPAHCSPGLTSSNVLTEIWTEGELNGVALMLAVEAVGLTNVGIQGMAGAGGHPHVRHYLEGRRVFIYADEDRAGAEARIRWARLALELGATPYMLPALPDDMDATEFLGSQWRRGVPNSGQTGATVLGSWLKEHIDVAPVWTDLEAPAEPAHAYGDGFQVWPYVIQDGRIGKLTRTKDGPGADYEFQPLLGFTARIVADVIRDSGDGSPLRVFMIEGRTPDGRELPGIEVPTKTFSSMTWPPELWGADGFIYPGNRVRDEARAALVSLSQVAGMERRTVYTRTGWTVLPEHGPVFLTAGACIGAAGAVPGVSVSLIGKLQNYALPAPPDGDAEVEAIRSALVLLELAPASLMFPLLGMVFRAPLGNVRFSGWLESRTGLGKSTLAAVLMSFFGESWIAAFPPADFQSTDNALNLGAFLAQDVLYVADDFKPEGTRAAIDAEHAKLSRLLSSAGNRSGRDRMTADALAVRQGYYPRGLVLATAESSPRRHSDVARTVALTVAAPLFGPGGPTMGSARFDAARQLAEEGSYARCMAGFLRWVAHHYPEVTGRKLAERVQAIARQLPGTHGRTSANAAELIEAWNIFVLYAMDCGAISERQAQALGRQAADALRMTSASQVGALENVDPVARFFPLLSGLLRTGEVYLRDAETGEAPGAESGQDSREAPAAGWFWQACGDTAAGGGEWKVRPGAVPVGYLGLVNGRRYAFLEANVYARVNRAAEGEGHGLPPVRSLWQALRERHVKSEAMLVEPGKLMYRRRVYGCEPKQRIAFYNVIWPLPVEERDTGDTT
ncbi:hypothetical protein ACI3L1_07575 [Deinococcus sp. SM5_A1]|uniref:hypothetical protein n=1 Tax=Deinococcus sp. SM5_A1 TaxID=3379094 RepID=UPI00385C6B12